MTKHAYTIPEVAETLGLSRKQVYKLFDKGLLERTEIGKSVRITQRQLDECIKRLEAGEGKKINDE